MSIKTESVEGVTVVCADMQKIILWPKMPMKEHFFIS